MSGFRRWLALSDHPIARAARGVKHGIVTFSLPAPVLIVRPLLGVFLAIRACYYFLVRIFVCEPLFKAYCTQYGRGVRTGVYIHWVSGRGKLILGDNVLVDGKCSFNFAVRYVKEPLLSIGSNTIVSHGCSFTIGQQVRIGEHCLIAMDVLMFDAPGHPTDPVRRKMGAPADLEDVRPIEIQDNVWVGRNAIIFPGVTVGEGSVVVAGSLVMNDVPAYTIVAGNPARVIERLPGAIAPERDGNTQTVATIADRPGASLNGVMAILREALGTGDLRPDEDFYDAGMTSIMVLPLLVEIEQRFGLTISESEFLDACTGQQLADRIDGQVNPRPAARA